MTRSQLVVLFAILGPFVWFFGSVLFQDRAFGFRDAANYYDPLFEWQCKEWGAGRIPLWNPLDNAGTPVLAETSSSVLYPGKIVFTLPLSYRLRYNLYVTLHVLLAVGTAYKLARRWGSSTEAAGLAAISYAFGGGVVFQYCNVIFLVGAAWLPASLYCADRMLRERSARWALMLGAVLALMTLGGDPQAAYHGGLLAALYAVLLGRSDDESALSQSRWWQPRLILLTLAATSGLCLALVQILPAMEWTRRGDRATSDKPRNVYELATSDSHDVRSLFETPETSTHLRRVYDFSVGRWHIAEFLWPNVMGRTFPKNARWITKLPAEGRTWTPSLYLGLLPMALALITLKLRKTDSRIRFVSLVSVLAVLGSFGWYGTGWLLHELQAAFAGTTSKTPAIGYPVGGVYWFLVVLLPGYVQFRYPAKLLVVASLAISLLAARGWDNVFAGNRKRLEHFLIGLAALTLVIAAVFGFIQPVWNEWLHPPPSDMIFGPVDPDSATTSVLAALAQTAVVSLGCWLLLRQRRLPGKSHMGQVVVVLTAIDLCIANGWMVISVDSSTLQQGSNLADAMAGDLRHEENTRLFLNAPATFVPKEWSRESSDTRMSVVVEWERAALWHKHHLHHEVPVAGTHTTINSHDWTALLRVVQETNMKNGRGLELLSSFSAGYVALSSNFVLADCQRMPSGSLPGVELWYDSRAYPRSWIAHDMRVLDPLSERSHAAIESRTREVFLEGDVPRDLRATVFIEAAAVGPPLPVAPPTGETNSRSRIIRYGPQEVEIEATLDTPGILVLNDLYYPGWKAERATDGKQHQLTVYRANRLMRAVLLPAGTHRVTFSYRPASFRIGAAISAIAWIALCVALAYGRRLSP